MNAVILAAGRGKRMGALTRTCPKPLLPVHGRPIVVHILRGLMRAGVKRATLVVGYLGQQIQGALGNGQQFGLQLEYVWQPTPLGTADALLLARPTLPCEPFFLSWGDVLVAPENYARLRAAFEEKPAAAWIGVNEVDDPCAGAAVYFDATGRVSRIVEKPKPGTSTTRWNNAGVGIYAPVVFDYAGKVSLSERGERELPQALDLMIAAGETVYALPFSGFWSDLGTPEALAWAEKHYPSTE